MNQVRFSQNNQDFLIPFEDEQSLCSFTDPQGEGLRWAYSFGALPSNHIVIIGLGAGFHVAALADIHPGIKITVIDNRENLIPIFKAQFADLENRIEVLLAGEAKDLLNSEAYFEIVENRSFVLSFFECWGSQQDILSGLFATATGRTLESVRFHFADLKMDLKAFHVKNKNMINIIELLPEIDSIPGDPESKQVFRILGELAQS